MVEDPTKAFKGKGRVCLSDLFNFYAELMGKDFDYKVLRAQIGAPSRSEEVLADLNPSKKTKVLKGGGSSALLSPPTRFALRVACDNT